MKRRPVNSLRHKVSKIVPKNGKRFRFEYEYDFGDGWEHEILFEGCLKAEKGTRYPLCMEGQRACPPEDVGGPFGYQEYLEALADPKHERHKEFMEWSGRFDPEKFDAEAATKECSKGCRIGGRWSEDGDEPRPLPLFGQLLPSRFAEHLFNWLAESKGLHWRADSRGLAVGRAGNIGPISRHAVERLHVLNIPVNGDSRFPNSFRKPTLPSRT